MDPDKHFNALNKNTRIHWYEVQAILGQGGFGITYLAYDTKLKQRVAIKEYLPSEFSTRDASNTVQPISENHSKIFNWGLQRFLEEAQTLAQFKHPNIVRVQTYIEENNTAYMIMEYEEGDDFHDLIKRGETFSESRLLELFLPILDGLEKVHAAGFIHRDIKPANIFIRSDGSPVLIDFGSARNAIGGHTRTMTSLVSPGFAPFEQYDDSEGKQGPWTDIYALGATLYCAITGKPPVDAIKRGIARFKHNTDAYLSLVDLKADKYSEHFLQAIDYALRFIDKDRPDSIAVWRSTLLGELEVPSVDNSTEVYVPTVKTVIPEIEISTQPEIAVVLPDTETDEIAPTIVEPVPDQPPPSKSEAPSGKRGWIPAAIVGIAILFGIVITLVVLRDPLVHEVDTTNDELEAARKTVEKLQAELERNEDAERLATEQQKQEDILQQAKPERDLENQVEAEKQQQARIKLQQQQKQQELQAELARLEAEKKLQEIKSAGEKEALAKKAAEKQRQAELAKQQKREQETAARLAAQKKQQAEQIRIEQLQKKQAAELAQKKISQQNQLALAAAKAEAEKSERDDLAQQFVNISGTYKDRRNRKVEIKQVGNEVTGTVGIDRKMKGVRNGNRLDLDFFANAGWRAGTGEFQISADGSKITGTWDSNPYTLERVAKTPSSVQETGLEQPSIDISGIYRDPRNRKVEIKQVGNEVTGTVGIDRKMKGTVDGNRLDLDFYANAGWRAGTGEFQISADGSKITGTWDSNPYTLERIDNASQSSQESKSKSPVIDISGTYISEITYAKESQNNKLRYFFGRKPRIQVEIVQTGNTITAKMSGDRSGQIEGKIVGDKITYDFFMKVPGGTVKEGEGTWTLSDDLASLTGNWDIKSQSARLKGTWDLKKF